MQSSRILVMMITILIFASPALPTDPSTTASGAGPSPLIAVQGENYGSSNVTDPALVPGSEINVTVDAFNLPNVIDRTQGGVQGFDITIDYNSSIIQPQQTGFDAPFCSYSDDCLFANLTATQFLTFENQTSLSSGSLRIGMVVYHPADRASGSGVLFKIRFIIIARGVSPITVDTENSQLIGYAQGCGTAITSYAVQNWVLDNRQPWIVTANPASATLGQGSSLQVQITVIRVNSDADVTLLAPWGSFLFILNGTFSPRTGLLDQASGRLNFTSTLTIKTNSSAPMNSYVVPIVAHDTAVPGGFREYRLNYTVTIDPPLYAATHPQSGYLTERSVPAASTGFGLVPTDPPLPLLANFTYASSPSNAENVIFASAVCGGIGPYSYNWNLGDGTTGSGNIVSHTFSAAGTYTVTLKVSDSNNVSFTVTQEVTVSSPSGTVDLAVITVLSALFILVIVGVYFWRKRRR